MLKLKKQYMRKYLEWDVISMDMAESKLKILIPALWKMDDGEFKDSLGYRASSRKAWSV
jgi:hypothetical protein